MKLCQSHWDKLRAAIQARGLDGLVPTSGEQAASKFRAMAESGKPSKASFDPLMAANLAIFNRALEMVGLSLMNPNADGSERCPICFIKSEHDRIGGCTGCLWEVPAEVDRYWMDGPADMARSEAIRLGLLACG